MLCRVIETRRLRTLRAVADHGTVTAAAAALHLTPSAVSQQLIALEHEVGHRLFTRDGRGVRLTAVGKIMLAHANEVLAQLERAEAEVAAYTTGAAGEVTVASFATAIGAVLSPAIRTLRDTAPGLQLRVLDAEGDQSLTMLMDGAADLAIAVEYRGAPDEQRLTRFPLYAEPFDLLLPARTNFPAPPLDHPLPSRANLPATPPTPHAETPTASPTTYADLPTASPTAHAETPAATPATQAGLPAATPTAHGSAPATTPSDPPHPHADPANSDEPLALAALAGETWIGPYPGNPVHDVITFACEREGFTPNFAHSSDDFRAVVALVGAGAGVALVPRLALRDLDLTGVVVRQAPGPERRVFAAVRRGAEQHPLLRPLLDALHATAGRLFP